MKMEVYKINCLRHRLLNSSEFYQTYISFHVWVFCVSSDDIKSFNILKLFATYNVCTSSCNVPYINIAQLSLLRLI